MAVQKFKIADLRCPIEVRGKSRTRDSIGGFSIDWVSRGQTWALIEDMSKGESYRAMRTEALVGQRVIIRAGSIPNIGASDPSSETTPATLTLVFDEPINTNDSPGLELEGDYSLTLTVDGEQKDVSVSGVNAGTYNELFTSIADQAGLLWGIVDSNVQFSTVTVGDGSSIEYSAADGDIFSLLAGLEEVPTEVGTTVEIPGDPGVPAPTADDVVVYGGRTMPIKAINSITEGRVEYQELICVQGDPTGPGL